jgi:hypothetical protein
MPGAAEGRVKVKIAVNEMISTSTLENCVYHTRQKAAIQEFQRFQTNYCRCIFLCFRLSLKPKNGSLPINSSTTLEKPSVERTGWLFKNSATQSYTKLTFIQTGIGGQQWSIAGLEISALSWFCLAINH